MRVLGALLAAFVLSAAAPASAADYHRPENSPTAAAVETTWEDMNVLQKTFYCIVTPCGWIFKGLWYVFVYPFTADELPEGGRPEEAK